MFPYWNCDKCKKETADITIRNGDKRKLCDTCYKDEYMRSNLSEEDLKIVHMIEAAIEKGMSSSAAYTSVSDTLNIPLSKCKSRYYAKWKFALRPEIKAVLKSKRATVSK